MKSYTNDNQLGEQSGERNIVTKTIASVLGALTIAAFSIGTAYVLVTTVQPVSATPAAAAFCQEQNSADELKIQLSNTCGEDKDKDKEGGGSSGGINIGA